MKNQTEESLVGLLRLVVLTGCVLAAFVVIINLPIWAWS